jgi:hypothetical protein
VANRAGARLRLEGAESRSGAGALAEENLTKCGMNLHGVAAASPSGDR